LPRKLIFAAAVLALVILCAVFQIAVVPTASMERTVLIGDHLLVNRMAFWFERIQRGEVVSFHPPGNHRDVYLKRVVAVGGDRVQIVEDVVYVNGHRESEPYVEHVCGSCLRKQTRLVVPEGQVFVLGDNRDRSEDSRYFGTVPVSNVVGKPVMVLWSFAIPTEKWLKPSQAALYLDHPLSHLRWARFFHPLQ
jgi:signal peptidase I